MICRVAHCSQLPTSSRLAKAHAGFGIIHDHIAKQIRCEPKILRKQFRGKLHVGAIEATTTVAQLLLIDPAWVILSYAA